LSELFETLPEVGDPDKPKLVFFFDEAHLLFDDAPKALLDKIEQVVRLIRSKGVGVYFVTQNPIDIPEDVAGQLGNRVQHALRAFTPRDAKAVRSAATTFRANPGVDVATVITELKVGEALVSVLQEDGSPSPVQRTLIRRRARASARSRPRSARAGPPPMRSATNTTRRSTANRPRRSSPPRPTKLVAAAAEAQAETEADKAAAAQAKEAGAAGKGSRAHPHRHRTRAGDGDFALGQDGNVRGAFGFVLDRPPGRERDRTRDFRRFQEALRRRPGRAADTRRAGRAVQGLTSAA
jgi:hypothetical protein